MLGTAFLQHVTSTLSFEVSISQVKEDYKEYFSQRNSKEKGKEEREQGIHGELQADQSGERVGVGTGREKEKTYACV